MSDNEEMRAAWDGPEGDHWAEHADRYQATSVRFREALFDALDLGDTSAVLDVGCGTGASTIGRAASRPRVSALGVDLSSRMLDGRGGAAAEGLDHVRFEQADAQVHPFELRPTTSPSAASARCSSGIRSPPSPTSGAHCGRAPHSMMLAWRDVVRNEWVDALRTALAAGRALPTPPRAPGPVQHGGPGHHHGAASVGGYRTSSSLGRPAGLPRQRRRRRVLVRVDARHDPRADRRPTLTTEPTSEHDLIELDGLSTRP